MDVQAKQFTVWLETLVRRSRIDYLRKIRRNECEIPFTSLNNEERKLLEQVPVIDEIVDLFTNEALEEGFRKLSERQQCVLRMTYFEGMTATEISKSLHVSRQYIYNQRYLGLKALKEMMNLNNGKNFL